MPSSSIKIGSSSRLLSTRILYLLPAIPVLIAGLASRKFLEHLPVFLAEYAGDTLWALMLFLVLSFVLAGRPILQRCCVSLALAFAVEVSQLYHAPWIDSIRSTTLGGLVLGFGFLSTDLVCYSVGITVGALTEYGLVYLRGRTRDSLAR